MTQVPGRGAWMICKQAGKILGLGEYHTYKGQVYSHLPFPHSLSKPIAFATLKMFLRSISVAAILAALPATFALPNVTAKALPADCSSYPDYDAETGKAGPWILNLANSDNPDIEGWGDSDVYSVANSPAGPRMRFGYVSIVEVPEFVSQ